MTRDDDLAISVASGADEAFLRGDGEAGLCRSPGFCRNPTIGCDSASAIRRELFSDVDDDLFGPDDLAKLRDCQRVAKDRREIACRGIVTVLRESVGIGELRSGRAEEMGVAPSCARRTQARDEARCSAIGDARVVRRVEKDRVDEILEHEDVGPAARFTLLGATMHASGLAST